MSNQKRPVISQVSETTGRVGYLSSVGSVVCLLALMTGTGPGTLT